MGGRKVELHNRTSSGRRGVGLRLERSRHCPEVLLEGRPLSDFSKRLYYYSSEKGD